MWDAGRDSCFTPVLLMMGCFIGLRVRVPWGSVFLSFSESEVSALRER